jgi:predicted amidohydrolase
MHRGLSPNEPTTIDRITEQMGRHVDHAAGLKPDLVAFPEVCNQAGGDWQFEPLDGPTVSAMRAKSRQHGIYIVCPLPTLEGSTRRNSSVLIGRDGKIVGVYHKNVPTIGELDKGIIPGTQTPVFETDFGRLGLCICFDLNYWEVGSGLCAGKADLVIWSSMWTGTRMMGRWAMEFGFYMAGVHTRAASFIDQAGRTISSVGRGVSDSAGAAPLLTATLDLDLRLLHHDGNVGRLRPLFEKYGPTAAHAEHIGEECLLLLSSRLPDKTTDELIEEFKLEPMRDYLARVRRDRQLALDGKYKPHDPHDPRTR